MNSSRTLRQVERAAPSAPRSDRRAIVDVPRDVCNDAANATRFARQHSGCLRYVHAWNRWLEYDGTRWKVDDSGAVMRCAKLTASSIYSEAADCLDDGLQASLADWAKQSHSRSRLDAMVELSKSERPLPVGIDDLDADPWVLNFSNGTVDLHSGAIRSHAASDLITKTTGIPYPTESGDEPVMWLEFLDQIFVGDHELIAFVRRLIGSALPGEVVEHKLPILYGGGSNGKGVFTETMLAALGDYGCKAPANLLIASRGERHPCDLADLHGKRLVFASETGEGQRFNEPLVKELCGGDTIKARRMRENPWAFEPSHQLFLSTNHRPVVKGTDNGIWRRILLIPFAVTFDGTRDDKFLRKKLRQEMGSIAKWAVEGCLAWQRDGLDPPASVVNATQEYRTESDTFARWFDERCQVEEHAWCKAGEAFENYSQWCQQFRERGITQTAFGRRIVEKPFTKTKTRDGYRYDGFGLIL